MINKLTFLAAATLFLGACAGGGSSLSDSGDTPDDSGSGGGGTTPPPDPVVGTVITDGTAILASITNIVSDANGDITDFTIGDVASNAGNAVTVTETETEASIAFTGSLEGGTVLADQSAIPLTGTARTYDDGSEDPFLQIVMAGNDSVLGEILYGTADGLVYGFFHGGTAATNMPSTGTATYVGTAQASGLVVGASDSDDNGDIELIDGVATLTADFGASTLSGTLNEFENGDDGSSAGVDVNIAGVTISGTSYSGGTITVTETAGGADIITGITSRLNGGFYGDSASETAGAFQLTGTMGGGTVAVAGGFRADKQ